MSKLITSSSHGPGYTCLTFSHNGSRAYTGGSDCIVRIWTMSQGAEQEPDTAPDADQGVTSVAAAEDCWLSGSEDGEVRRYARDRGDLDSLVTSAKAVAIRCVAIDPRGRRVAVASDEMEVKVVDMEDTIKVTKLLHKSGVRKISWHPSDSLLTSCDVNGTISVWDLSGDEPKLERSMDGIIPVVRDASSSEFMHDCSVVWHTSGKHFYVATRAHEIVTISRADWTKSSTFSDKDISGPITALALSPNGVYLASASRSKVHVWSTQTRRVVASHAGNPGSTITQLAFSPRENLIAWSDSDGVFSRWVKPIADTLCDPVKHSISTNAAATTISKPRTEINLFGEDLTDTRLAVEDDFADVDLDHDMYDEDFVIDDLLTRDEPAVSKSYDPFVKEMVSIVKAQPPFQPGCTPMENKKRYLAYNMIGVIEVTDQDTHHIVNVEFFDRSARKGYHFTDHFKYDLGYLGERGAVFACQPEEKHPAQVLYKPYGSWTSSQSEWTYQLKRKGTKVLGVTAGGLALSGSHRQNVDSDLQGFGNVVVATSESDLTFLSGTGRERRIIGLGDDYVSMAAGPEWVFVVHRAGSTTIDGSQSLSYTIINFEDFSVRQRGVLPIPKGHTLKWIGLTDQGAPAIYDSTGWVHILMKHRIPHHALWSRVMDTNLLERRQGKDESYWPVGITGSLFMCLILKGRQEYPAFPRPLIQELPMCIPFRREDPKEERVEREMMFLQESLDSLDDELTTDEIVARERAIDKEFIQLIQAACKADNAPRAIELTRLLHHTPSFDAAIKIADFYHLVGLAEKLQTLKTDREQREDRLVAARNKRRRWLKPDAAPREVQNFDVASSSRSRFDPLGDERPPPSIQRPGMARVTVPIIEPTRYTSMAPPSRDDFSSAPPSSAPSPTSQDGKRKRDEAEDPFRQNDSDFSMPPPKQKSNPFARKPGQDSGSGRNPFARKAESIKPIQKSESFFDKVDAAEADAGKLKRPSAKGKEKEREKKDGTRQTTLFGMMPGSSANDKKSRPKTKSAPSKSAVDKDVPESQSTEVDIPMSDATNLVESQEDSQVSEYGTEGDTQVVDQETQEEQETQLVE